MPPCRTTLEYGASDSSASAGLIDRHSAGPICTPRRARKTTATSLGCRTAGGPSISAGWKRQPSAVGMNDGVDVIRCQSSSPSRGRLPDRNETRRGAASADTPAALMTATSSPSSDQPCRQSAVASVLFPDSCGPTTITPRSSRPSKAACSVNTCGCRDTRSATAWNSVTCTTFSGEPQSRRSPLTAWVNSQTCCGLVGNSVAAAESWMGTSIGSWIESHDSTRQSESVAGDAASCGAILPGGKALACGTGLACSTVMACCMTGMVAAAPCSSHV